MQETKAAALRGGTGRFARAGGCAQLGQGFTRAGLGHRGDTGAEMLQRGRGPLGPRATGGEQVM